MNIEELEKENKNLKSKIRFYEQALKEDSLLRKKYSSTLQTLKEKEKELQDLNNNLETIIQKEIEKNIQKDKILQQQSRIVALGEMINNIAHQWRQPLSIITTSISALSLKAEYAMVQNNDIIETNELILKNANQLSKTIDIFKNFFDDNTKSENFIVSTTITKNLEMLKTSFDIYQIKLDVTLDKNIQYLGNFEQLFEVISNILKNSQDAFMINHIEDKIIIIHLYQENNHIIIDLQDNGGGIDENIINSIFDPYFTTKHQTQGTGLGLYISLEIITKYFNGNILASNIITKMGKGAHFKIVFPINIF